MRAFEREKQLMEAECSKLSRGFIAVSVSGINVMVPAYLVDHMKGLKLDVVDNAISFELFQHVLNCIREKRHRDIVFPV